MVQMWEQVEVVIGRPVPADPGLPNPQPDTMRKGVWVDIAEVTVPGRTRRRKVIEDALEQAEISAAPDAPKLRLRVLDADSAEETPVRSKPRPPELLIGGAE